MIKGFERETFVITEEEINVAHGVFSIIAEACGFITSSEIIEKLKEEHGIEVEPPRIRKMIHYARAQICFTGFIIATSKGYKFTNDLKELQDYKTGLHQRIGSQVHIYNELEKIVDRKER